MDDVHRSGCAEHCDLAGWPSVVEVGSNGFGSHHDVGTAEGFSQDHGDQRHLRVGVGVDHFRTAADDARMFLFGSRLVSGGVHQGDDRQVERVAQTHESCHFFGGIHVEDARVDVRLVGHNADRMPVHAGESHHCGACEQLVHLHEFAVVHDAADHVEHVVWLAIVVGHDGGESFGHVTVGAGCGVRVGGRLQVGVGWQVGEHGSCVVDRVGFVFAQIVRHSGGGVVHIAATEIVHADHFAGGRFDHVRTGDEHVGVLAGHDDQVGQRRAVHGSARARAENQRKLRHETAGVTGFTEQMPVLRQCGYAFLNAGAARIDERDDWHLQVERLVHQSADLAAFRNA